MNRKHKKIPFSVHRDYIRREAQYFRDHKKGVPEWIKNSDDSYIRHEDSENKDLENAPIIININKKVISCLDFGGAVFEKIKKHLFYWGDPKAATYGQNLKKKMVSGGHGNGGKYYALSQFDKCKIINYYGGRLSVFVIQDDADYIEIENEEATPWEAVREAGIDEWKYFDNKFASNSNILIDKINNKELNFFCWNGIGPKDKPSLSDKRKAQLLLSSVSNYAQSRSALRTRNVIALFNGELLWPNMKPEEPEKDEGFGVREFALPNRLGKYEFNKHGNSILKIYLSKEPFTGERSSLNILEIDAFGRNIAYYDIPSFIMDKTLSKSLFAHIDCPELKEYGCVSNDRVNLIESLEATGLFNNWCRSKIREVLEELTNKEKQKEEKAHLNELRNFLDIVTDEISDLLEEESILRPTFSRLGKDKSIVKVKTDESGFGKDGKGGRSDKGERRGKEDIKEEKSEDKKGKSKLKILLSNHDPDPLNPGKTFIMSDDPRYPILHQRTIDVDYGIWWINSQKRYVKKLDIRDPSAYPFYFFLVKEIVLSHRLRKLYREQSNIIPDDIERIDFELIDEIFNKIVERLGIDLATSKSNAEKIREAIQNRQRFTIAEIATETGTDSLAVHAFISNPANNVKDSFDKKKQKANGRGGKINVYVRK